MRPARNLCYRTQFYVQENSRNTIVTKASISVDWEQSQGYRTVFVWLLSKEYHNVNWVKPGEDMTKMLIELQKALFC
jgi:hypothetical protein